IANAFASEVFPGGLTYSGHPLAMASIVATLDAMRDEKMVENAASIGADVLGPGLRELAAKHPMIGEVRGVGVFWALDLVDDPKTRNPVGGAVVADVKNGLMAAGLLPFTADNRIHVVPPCNVTSDEVAAALAIYDKVFAAVSA
ncbi:MAG TPA: aminotransferase class III-fold pyridoxal phosphate-dependent enzyme, partial [Galbitalea sp.]